MVTVANNDSDEGSYTFGVRGGGAAPAPTAGDVAIIGWSDVAAPTSDVFSIVLLLMIICCAVAFFGRNKDD